MSGLFPIVLFTLFVATPASFAAAEERLPIIDAHSQLEHRIAPERVIELMNRAKVSRTILSARRKTTIKDMVLLARRYPDRITAAVRTKGRAYLYEPVASFQAFLNKQLKHPEFGAMAEVLMFHARKTNNKGRTIAPEVAFPPGHRKPTAALDVARSRGWPFIMHIEFAKLDKQRSNYMARMEAMMRAYPDHPFVLIHMGQLSPEEAARLLAAHANLHFIPAHTTPTTLAKSREPWTALFDGGQLSAPWRDLILSYPDRFVLGFDNVWAKHWQNFYIPQVKLWRQALGALPEPVAHSVAHRNAERLWELPPTE